MPAQKRPYEVNDVTPPPELDPDDNTQRRSRSDSHEQLPADDPAAADAADGNASDRSHSSSDGEKEEDVFVTLSEIRKEVQCPICLGIIRKTRTVMECLHRFCRECIDKAMRMGNNECPACRTHCASRRSLRDDANYDALIAALYPDVDKYEEEELAFLEEEEARNKQIQASIAQTFRRQTEALGRKRTAKARRSQGRHRDTPSRGRRNYRATELQGSDDNEEANGDGGKDSSSAEERSVETRPKRSKRWTGARFSQPSSANACAGGVGDELESETNRESMGVSAGLIGPSERLAWGKGGIRSHTRYGSLNGGNGKNARNSRISKLVDSIRNLEGKDYQSDIHLLLLSFDEEIVPSLQQPSLCCRPTLSVRHLLEYVANQTALQANEIEMYLVNKLQFRLKLSALAESRSFKSIMSDPSEDNLQLVHEQETLAGLITQNPNLDHLLLVYKNVSV